MKRIGIALIAAAILIASSVSNTSANGKLDRILANMQSAGSKIRALYASMEQQKLSVELGGTEHYSGQIFFKHKGKDDKLHIKYTKPAGQELWVIGDKVCLYQPRIKQVIITSRKKQASKNPEMSFVATPYNSVPALKSQYNIAYLGDEGGQAKLHLTPKGRSSVKEAFLWVDQSIWLPVKFHFIQTNNDMSTIILSGLQVNGIIADGQFNPRWPAGTKEIRP